MWRYCQREERISNISNDLMQECKTAAPGARLSPGMRNNLEKYQATMRKTIVSRQKDGCAPLFIACRRGNAEIVEYLINVCQADIEQRGLYEVPDDRSVHCVTPLWCAAVSGRLQIIEILVSHGAKIDAVSDTGSTPVRSACFMTHPHIVMYLVKKGADIFRANYNGGTCLINSVQSYELCKFLLQNKADVNARDVQNKTALHYAIQEHRFATAKLLLYHNADPTIRSSDNDDALQIACLKGSTQIFEYLIKNFAYSPQRLANAHELMGSTFLEEDNAPQSTIKYWRIALAIRNAFTVNNEPLRKRPVIPKRECFGNVGEFTTVEELDAIALDVDAIRIQSLLICERILGPHHKDTLFRLIHRGASYADSLRHQRCIDLWRRALKIRVEKDSILCSDTCFIAQALVKLMVDINEKKIEYDYRMPEKRKPEFSDVEAIFHLLATPLTAARQLLEIRPVHKRQQESYNHILKCVTHLIYLLVETARTESEKVQAQLLVCNLVKQNPRSASTGDSLLHLCASRLNTIRSSYFSSDDIPMIFPHFKVIKLLLLCGAHVNVRNKFRSTPLHVASNAYNFSNPLIKLLLDHGAHLDMPNKFGDTPARLISLNPHNSVNLVNYITLKCLAAQTICKYAIHCTEVPRALYRFLEFHKE
ncbi:protein fem-1 homolog C [Neodiprion virginianus]|uniref:protein fem-1 homolog C n=1 Tax=Neodiprion virginianus TaxID=2961670 RepID=UPI001EE7417A|nr:protein fem-1 homolog C [Neodiprion virginianus]XP_046611074.1 protein fem-1 homolog C [Neodiprion virginianus]